MPLINIQDLHVSFSDGRQRKHVVKSAHFQVNEGETFSLIGASGCGKSTILRVIAGLQREWQGQIDLLGSPLRPQKRLNGEIRRNVQMVFQDPYASLHPQHRLYRSLAEPLQIHREPNVEQRVAEALQQVGLPADAAQRFPHQISEGNANASPLPAPCCCGLKSYCSMSPLLRSICRFRLKSLTCLTC